MSALPPPLPPPAAGGCGLDLLLVLAKISTNVLLQPVLELCHTLTMIKIQPAFTVQGNFSKRRWYLWSADRHIQQVIYLTRYYVGGTAMIPKHEVKS